MKIHANHICLRIAAICLGCVLFACSTIDYRGIQSQFEQVVQIDNASSVSVFTEGTVFTEPGYDDVLASLTPQYIQKLDGRLRPNAWLLRAVSQYRTGQLAQARESAATGLSEPQLIKSSRDHILLLMIPGLVIDMEIEKTWKASGRQLTPAQYARLELDYHSVFDLFDTAQQAMGQASAPGIRFYINYQRWRVVQGWRSVINSIDAGSDMQDEQAQIEAQDKAKQFFGGMTLKDKAVEQENKIPVGHPLRSLIAVQSR